MACYHPVEAWQLESGEVVFAERGKVLRALTLPCGQCVGCRLERSRQWAVRCLHESRLHSQNSFITLTYDDKHLPSSRGLEYRDFQLFMKRLRKKVAIFDPTIWMNLPRYFACGEYGVGCRSCGLSERECSCGHFVRGLGRPHFHACIFGYDFPDKVLFRNLASGSRIFRSKFLEELWPFGFCSCGEVTFESAAYVARYIMKKITGNLADEHYWRVSEHGEIVEVAPEVCHMSLKPGIGARWFELFYKSDVAVRDKCIVNGREVRVPRSYDRYLKRSDSFGFDALEFDRYVRAGNVDFDSSIDRLAVRETVAKARLSFLKRGLI